MPKRNSQRGKMKEMTSGTALRQLQQAQAGLKKARQLLKHTRGESPANPAVLRAGWESLAQANRMMGEIPVMAADETVMTRQLAVQRYATALLVRLRRLLRNEGIDNDGRADEDDRFADEDFED
jgi:hypothetical protein